MSKEIKQLLKEARTELANKNFPEVITKCLVNNTIYEAYSYLLE